MGKFDGFLICSDIDGTLTSDVGISDENKEAIEYFQSEGGLFTVATGRFPGYIEKMADRFVPNTYTVCINGTLLYDDRTGRVITTVPITVDEVLSVSIEIAKKNDFLEGVYACGRNRGENVEYFYRACEVRKNPDILREEKLIKDPDTEWLKMIFTRDDEAFRPEQTAEWKAGYGGKYEFCQSWPGGMEVLSGKAGKGVMVEYLRKCAGRPIHTTVAVGDYENDIQMIQMADIGYAVGNAPYWVKESADRVTVDCDHSAIAAVISDLEKDAAQMSKKPDKD